MVYRRKKSIEHLDCKSRVEDEYFTSLGVFCVYIKVETVFYKFTSTKNYRFLTISKVCTILVIL